MQGYSKPNALDEYSAPNVKTPFDINGTILGLLELYQLEVFYIDFKYVIFYLTNWDVTTWTKDFMKGCFKSLRKNRVSLFSRSKQPQKL